MQAISIPFASPPNRQQQDGDEGEEERDEDDEYDRVGNYAPLVVMPKPVMNSGHVVYLTERYCLFNSSPWELEIQGKYEINQRARFPSRRSNRQRPLRQTIKAFEEIYVRSDLIKVRSHGDATE